jgi:hypothetical protein
MAVRPGRHEGEGRVGEGEEAADLEHAHHRHRRPVHPHRPAQLTDDADQDRGGRGRQPGAPGGEPLGVASPSASLVNGQTPPNSNTATSMRRKARASLIR